MLAVDDDLEAVVWFGPLLVDSFSVFFVCLCLVVVGVLCAVVAFVVVGVAVGSYWFGVWV